jgi:hypothetical protein
MATAWLVEHSAQSQPDVLAGAAAYLKLAGDTIGGWMLARGALAAAGRIAGGASADPYWRTRIALAHLYGESVLALAPGLAAAVELGATDLMESTADALSGAA